MKARLGLILGSIGIATLVIVALVLGLGGGAPERRETERVIDNARFK
jgi:hypothetical protein